MVRMMVAGLLVLGAVATSEAQMLYRYVDKDGQVHMTDDPNKLPKGQAGTVDAMRTPRPTTGGPTAADWERRALEADNRIGASRGAEVTEACKKQSGADAYTVGNDVRYFGTARERFEFERCLAGKGFPVPGR